MIRAELVALGEKYGDKRRTQLATGEELAYDPRPTSWHEDATVILSRRRVAEARARGEGSQLGRGLREGDALAAVLPGTTRDRLVLVLDARHALRAACGRRARHHRLRRARAVAPQVRRRRAVVAAQLLREDGGGEAQSALPGLEKTAILVATAKGYGFPHTPDLSRRRARGGAWRASRGRPRSCRSSRHRPDVVVATRRGKMLRFALDEVAELSGPGRGVILMRASKEDDDRIVGALALPKQAVSSRHARRPPSAVRT